MKKITDKLMTRTAALAAALLMVSANTLAQVPTLDSALKKVETMEKSSRDIIFRIIGYLIGFICLVGLGYQIFMRVKEGESRGNSGIAAWFVITLLAIGGMELVKSLYFT